eukprot:scaffold140063_cov33-Tisochrysis_lutea.AAC.2
MAADPSLFPADAGERSYHIFYCLLRGANPELQKRLRLTSTDPKSYKYLASGEKGEAGGGRTDKQLFNDVSTALSAQEFTDLQIEQLWMCLAGVMHLGSIAFDSNKPDAAAVLPACSASISASEAVLGLQQGILHKALCKRKIKAGREFVEQDLSFAYANDNRDALAKAIYSKLFDRLIAQINVALAAGGADLSSSGRIIGIVDIFGFEIFEKNSLEQLCINFANEKLQALFTKTVFAETIKAYKQDGIDAADITYTDNSDLITLFEAPQTGLLAVLTEECLIPKGTDEAFTEKVMAAHPKSSVLTRMKGVSAREGFGINHFAGPVSYSTIAWLDKNKDPLNGDLVVLMQFSDNALLQDLFTVKEEATPGKKFKSTKFRGVIETFRSQLTDLVTLLDASDLHFVRCFKPNDAKSADSCVEDVISRQLHTSGVLDALRVARSGYPDRLPFADFFSTFIALAGLGNRAQIEALKTPKERVIALLDKLNVGKEKYKVGKERVFFAGGVLEMLKTRRVEAMAKVAGKLQAGARGIVARARVRLLRKHREEALARLVAACDANDIETLRKGVFNARAARVHLYPAGKAIIDKAEARLQALETELAARRQAEAQLDKVVGGSDIALLEAALAKAVETKADAHLIERAQRKLAALKAEEQRRKEEEAQLAAMKAAKDREVAEKALAEERKKREAEAAAAEAELLEKEEEERRAQEAARMRAAQEEADAAADKSRMSIEEEEQAAARAIEEEEALRKEVLAKLDREGVRFRSGTEDVLEYAVYLGMNLHEDLALLWIADQALQADDPEGWEQCESPNGDIYYMHEVTKQVLWQHPLDYQYQQLFLSEKKKVANGDKPGAPSRAASGGGAPLAAARDSPRVPDAGPITGNDDMLRHTLQSLLGTRHTELRSLLTEPAQCTTPVRCFVIRHKSRMGASKFDFFMSISKSDDMYCFTAKKHSVAKGCYYSIALDQDEVRRPKASSESFVGKVRSDRKSQEYTLYDDGASPDGKDKDARSELRKELLHVSFLNSLRNRNPGAMQVVMPQVDGQGNAIKVQPSNSAGSLAEKLKRGETNGLIELKNREPKWNPSSQMYQLDFHGRATMASCKNIQLHVKVRVQLGMRVLCRDCSVEPSTRTRRR